MHFACSKYLRRQMDEMGSAVEFANAWWCALIRINTAAGSAFLLPSRGSNQFAIEE